VVVAHVHVAVVVDPLGAHHGSLQRRGHEPRPGA
jgi:hypothetical protein